MLHTLIEAHILHSELITCRAVQPAKSFSAYKHHMQVVGCEPRVLDR